MDSGNSGTCPSLFKIRQGRSIPRVRPSFSLILTDMNSSPVSSTGSGITSLNKPAFLCNRGSGYHLMASRMLWSNHTRFTPSLSIICTCTQSHHQILPMSGRFHSIDMVKSPLAVVQQCSSGQITISYLIKHTRLFPFTASGTQARREHHHLTAFFFIGRKPHSQQVSIITPSQCRLMIMLEKRRSTMRIRFMHINQRSSEDWFRDTLRGPIPFYLRHDILIFWLRKRSGLRILCLYHPKACHCMFVLRQHSHTICRTEIFHRCIMTPSSGHPCHTVRIADRVSLFLVYIGPIPVQTPFLHISTHII